MKNFLSTNHYLYESDNESIFLLKTYIYIRLIFMLLSFIILIVACIGIFDIAEYLQHITYHAFDCCSFYH